MDNNFPNENNSTAKQSVSGSTMAGGPAPVVPSAPAGNYKKPRLIIAIISIVIFLSLLISGIVLLHKGADEDVIDVYTGSTYFYVDNTTTTFRFTPWTSGYYEIYTTGSQDTYGRLLDSRRNYLTANDDGGSSSNFYIRQYLSSGETYYIEVISYNGSGYVYFNIERDY